MHPGGVEGLHLHHQVRLRDGPRLRVQFLAEDDDVGLRVEIDDARHRCHEHPAGAGGRVVHGAHGVRVVGQLAGRATGDQQVDDELDDLARGVVLTCRLVTHLRELPQQFLEDVAHRLVAHDGRSQVEVGEVGQHPVQHLGAVHPLQAVLELVRLDDGVRGRGEFVDEVPEVGRDVLVVAEQRREGVP